MLEALKGADVEDRIKRAATTIITCRSRPSCPGWSARPLVICNCRSLS